MSDNNNSTPSWATPVQANNGQTPAWASPVQSQNSDGGSNIPNALMGGTALGGVAAAYGAARFINTPNRLIKPIDAQLQGIAKTNIGQQVSTSDLPSLLTAKYNQLKSQIVNPSLDAVDKSIILQKTALKNQRNLFDRNTLNPAIDDISKHIAGNYKPVVNAAYSAYRQQQNGIENIIEQSGQPLQSSDVASFLNKAHGEAIQQGVPEGKLAPLKGLADSLDGNEGNIVDLLGNKMDISKPIPFSQIKGNVTSLLGSLPDSAKHVLAGNWSEYMGKYLPPQAQQAFSNMQSQYSKFAPARNALFELIDQDKGVFKTTILANRLRSFVRTNQDGGLTNLLGVLGNGSDITPPMPGLQDKLSTVLALKNQRDGYQTSLDGLDTHRQTVATGIAQMDKQLQDAFQQHTSLLANTQNLLSQKAAIMEKFPIRSLLSNAPRAIVKGLLSKHGLVGGLGALGVVGALQDPAGAAESTLTGMPATEVAPAETPVNNANGWDWDKNGKLVRSNPLPPTKDYFNLLKK